MSLAAMGLTKNVLRYPNEGKDEVALVFCKY